jgi:hypothetical protein
MKDTGKTSINANTKQSRISSGSGLLRRSFLLRRSTSQRRVAEAKHSLTMLIVQGLLIGFKWPIQYITAVDGLLIILFVLVPGARRFYAM